MSEPRYGWVWMRMCEFPGCGAPWRGKGLCDAHLKQHNAGKPLRPLQIRRQRGMAAADVVRLFVSRAVEDENGCLILSGIATNQGYPVIGIDGGVDRVSRVVLAQRDGPANGRHCLHSCDNRSCINVEHLRWGTHTENVNDMVVRGRHAAQRLTPDLVREIRDRVANNEKGYALAKEFGVSSSAIYAIRDRRTWKHVT